MSLFTVSARCVRLGTVARALRLPLQPFRRSYASKYTERRKDHVTLERTIENRRSQARRSILVQVSSENSCDELATYCAQFAPVHAVHHYTLDNGSQHFMLVEFGDEADVDRILDAGSVHRRDMDSNPMRSQFLWFRADGTKLKSRSPARLVTTDGCRVVRDEELLKELQECENVSQQIERLYERLALNDLGVRLRYMVARQVETVFGNLHANIAVLPFGSSVNGFGKMGCDLDLVLTNKLEEDLKTSSKRLVYHSKKCSGGPTEQWRRHLELAGDVLRLCVPGAGRVRHILQARIPIIKYTHDLTGVECDLSASNVSGVYMSELLHLYGSLDTRVRPLTFAVRRWAAAVGLTNPSPGPWITNFSLTLLVVFFLQQESRDGAVLPPLQYLVERAGKEDMRITEDLVDCTFLRDVSRIPSDHFASNDSPIAELLLQFFEFYARFDLDERSVNVVTGRADKKPSHTGLYIVNPLERSLNVSRNVSVRECERLRLEIRNAAWTLETCLDRRREDSWGLLEVFRSHKQRNVKDLVRMGNAHRLVKVAELFNEEPEEKRNEFKNDQVRNEVKKIRQQTQASIPPARTVKEVYNRPKPRKVRRR